MPKMHNFSPEDEAYLRENHLHTSYVDMAKRFQCDTVTLKRHLVRLGLREFETAKLLRPLSTTVVKWRRPCLRCKSTHERPRFQYFCDPCTIKNQQLDRATAL